MISLLDVNLLIALAWPNHIHHALALDWFRRHHSSGWATCPVTQSGFVRVSSNRRVLGEAKTPREAIALLRQMARLPGHRFWTDDINLTEDSPDFDTSRIQGYRQVTDAHLLALALRNKGRLVTLDSGLRTLVPRDTETDNALFVIAAAKS
ncbi:MAG TPA: TA system VapC family ribonuclease toxin [Acidobacteriota bacterium]|nr:TA system VapC family ribonuclease toxin [Acidobacteriota bacterium]